MDFSFFFFADSGAAGADGYRLLLESKRAAGMPRPGTIDILPFGLAACRPALVMLIKYLTQQYLLPRSLTVDELFDDTTRVLGM